MSRSGPTVPRPALTIALVLSWADAHKKRTGAWPHSNSGRIKDGPRALTWRKIDNALRLGFFGLEGESSLAQLLRKRRGVRNVQDLPRLTKTGILNWAKAHRKRTGRWPTHRTGSVTEAPGETWNGIHMALSKGRRGLPGGTTLGQLLQRAGK